MMKKQIPLLALGGAIVLTAISSLPGFSGSNGIKMEVSGDDWNLKGFKDHRDISGIASANGSHCLLVSDEGLYVQPGRIDFSDRKIKATGAVKVQPRVKLKGSECDFEGATYCADSSSYFVVGSHGLSGKNGDFDPNRFAVYQIAADPRSGAIDRDEMKLASLLPWLESHPATASFVKKRLEKNGLDIEGVATKGGDLYFGLRGPNDKGDGLVLQLGIGALFDGEKGQMIAHRLPLGEGRGLRDIAQVRGGFLFIAGDSSNVRDQKAKKRFDLFFWDGIGSTPEKLGTLPDTSGKAEALLVLADDGAEIEVLVIFDSLSKGDPIQIKVHRDEIETAL